MVLDTLTEAVDKVCDADPTTLADREAMLVLHRELARLEAVTTRAAGAFDAGRDWAGTGARTAAAWISVSCNVPTPAANQRIKLGRDLRDMPTTEEAWIAGRIDRAHVSVLARSRTPTTEARFAIDEAELVEAATTMRFSSFAQQAAWWRYRADPDGTEQDAAAQCDDRRFHMSKSWQDMWFGDFTLDPVSGTIVNDELRRIEQELFDADWADACEQWGDDAAGFHLRRTHAQRRADALVEMAIRASTAPKDGRRPEPLFSVFVGYETFAGPMCHFADGMPVTPGALAPWLDQAWIERVVFDGPSRVIDVGAQRRIFRGGTRRAIELRDQQCYDPFCDIPAGRCQVDHIQPWSFGGPTIQANGRVACGFHNRARHRRRQ